MCLCLRQKKFMFGSFPGYAFGSHFCERFTYIIVHIHSGTPLNINTHSPWAAHIQQFCAQVVAAVTVWHHQPGWQCPSGVLLWSQRYPSTELILWRCCVTQGPRQAVQNGWQPWNESSRAGRNYWQDPGEQLWVTPKGLLKGPYGLFKSIKNKAQTPVEG